DLIAVGELATLLLSGHSGPAAVMSLPPRFAEFVRASAGTSECPSPTAKQLLDFLDGKPLAPVTPIELAPRAVTQPPQQHEAPVTSPVLQEEPQRTYTEQVSTDRENPIAPARRRGNILVAIAALIAIS